MTDEMTIQQRPSALPYMLGGAAVGTGAGLVANATIPYLKGSAMSHNDIVSEMNDKDKFEARTKEGVDGADTWKEAKKKQEALENAKKEVDTAKKALEDAKKTTIPDTAKEAQDLQNAKNARQAEFDRLLEIEKGKVKTPAGTAVVTELPTAEQMRLGIKGDDASKVAKDFNYYNTTLKPEYEKARKTVETTAGVDGYTEFQKAKTAKDAFKTSVDSYYDAVAKNSKEKDTKLRTAEARRLDKTLDKIVATEFKYPTKAEIMEQAFKNGQMIPAKGKFLSLTADYTDSKGNNYVLKDGVKFKDLNKAAKTAVDAQRANLAAEISATTAEYNTAIKNLDAFENKSEFRRTGKKGGTNTNFVCELTDIQGKDAVKNYTEQKRVMNKFLEGKKLTPKEKVTLSSIKTSLGLDPNVTSDSQKIVKQLDNRIGLASEYAKLNGAKNAAIGGQSRIALYETQMEDAIMSNKDVKSAAKKIKSLARRYGINVETTATTTATADEAALKAIVEKQLAGTRFETDITHAQKVFDEAAKKTGKVDQAKVDAAENLLKKKQENVVTANSEFEKATNELGEKYLKGGKAKWIAPVVGAVALGLGALALRPGSNEA